MAPRGGQIGVSLWRRISDVLADEIAKGRFAENERLPTSEVLSKRFSVHRHTVHKAIQHLEGEGIIRMERGRGTYFVVAPRTVRVGRRYRFNHNLSDPTVPSVRRIVDLSIEACAEDIKRALEIEKDALVLKVSVLGEEDGLPINLSENHFSTERNEELRAAFEKIQGSGRNSFTFTEVLASAGITDWRRASTHVRARRARPNEALALKLAVNDPILITSSLQTLEAGKPLWFSKSLYAASRTTLVIDL